MATACFIFFAFEKSPLKKEMKKYKHIVPRQSACAPAAGNSPPAWTRRAFCGHLLGDIVRASGLWVSAIGGACGEEQGGGGVVWSGSIQHARLPPARAPCRLFLVATPGRHDAAVASVRRSSRRLQDQKPHLRYASYPPLLISLSVCASHC